jgi:hypothetical protein
MIDALPRVEENCGRNRLNHERKDVT